MQHLHEAARNATDNKPAPTHKPACTAVGAKPLCTQRLVLFAALLAQRVHCSSSS
jgi:hypothetical protein